MNFQRVWQMIATMAVALALIGCAGAGKDAGEYVDDTVLTAKVKGALLKDPMVSGLDVNVESHKGMVQISGFVKTDAERERAHKIVHEVDGVTNVVNSIQLRR